MPDDATLLPPDDSAEARTEESPVRWRGHGGFSILPYEILDAGVSATAVTTFAWLARYANSNGAGWPGQHGLAERSGMSESTLRRSLRELEEGGFLETVRRGLGMTNLYLLKLPGSCGPDRSSVTGLIGQSDRSLPNKIQKNQTALVETDVSTPAPAKPSSTRKRDELWDVLVEELGEPETKSERGRRNKALKELREIKATPEQVRARCATYRQHWPGVTLTALALVANWTTLARADADAVPDGYLTVEEAKRRGLGGFGR